MRLDVCYSLESRMYF